MATGDITHAPKPKAGSNQRFDLVDHGLIADAFKAFADASHRGLLSTPVKTAGAPTGELWLGSITSNPVALDGLVRVDSTLFAGLDADGGLILVPDGVALTVAIPDDSSDYQVYLYSIGVAENSQVRRFLPAASPFTEFTQAQNVHVRSTGNLFTRAGGVGSVVADDVAGGETRPLLFLGVANNTGGTVTFTPAANRLETVTAPTNLPASSTGDVAGTTYSSGDQATLRGMLNAAMHAIARDRWLGSNNYTPSAANNFGAYTEPTAGLDVAVRKHTDFITIGDDAASVYGTWNRGNYATDDLLVAAVIAALPAGGGTVYIKPGVTLNNFAADVTIPADTRVTFMSDATRTDLVTTFDMGVYNFVCASGSTSGLVAFDSVSFATTSATTNGNILELHDGFALQVRKCFFKVDTVNAGTPVALFTMNAAATTTLPITIDDTTVDYLCATTNTNAGAFVLDTGVVRMDYVLVRNCQLKGTGDQATSANYGGSIIRVNNAGHSMRFLDTEFSTRGEDVESAGISVTAIEMTSTVWGSFGDRTTHLVRGCTFAGRNNDGASGTPNMYAIIAEDVENLRVTGCVFDNCKRGITFNCTSAYTSSRVNTDISNNIFRSFDTTERYAVALGGNGDHTGFVFAGNTVDNCGGLELVKATGDLYDIVVRDNTLTECDLEIEAQFVARNIHVTGNIFEQTGAVGAAPRIGSTTAQLYDLTFVGNTVRGYSTIITDDFVFGVHVTGTHISSAQVHGNLFENLQNVAYLGSSPSDQWRVVGFDFDTGGLISICDNQFANVAVSLSGANARSLQLMKLDSIIPNGTGTVERILVQGNSSGSRLSHVQIFHDRDHVAQNTQISDNVFMYIRQIGTIAAGLSYADLVFDRHNDPLSAGGTLIITNNIFDRGGTTSAHFIAIAGTNPNHLHGVVITGNAFQPASDISVGSYGVVFETTFNELIVTNNLSHVYDFSISDDPGGGGSGIGSSTLPTGMSGLANNAAVPDNLNFIMDV